MSFYIEDDEEKQQAKWEAVYAESGCNGDRDMMVFWLIDRREKLRAALEPLAFIYDRYLSNNLDECRPEWGHGEAHDLNCELFCGRGGRQLLTLRHCKTAWELLRK